MRHPRRKLAKLLVTLLFCLFIVGYLYVEELEDLVYKNYCALPKKVIPLGYNSKVCLIPKVYPFDPQTMQMVKKTDRLKCASKKRAALQGGYLTITDPDVTSVSYRKVNRVPGDDFTTSLGKSIVLSSLSGRPIPVKDEFIELKLKTADGKIHTEFFLQAVARPGITSRRKIDTELDLSVLIIGIDSISNGHAQRKLPKSYRFMKDVLGGYIFMGHSVVGDGTTEQLAALLTGKGERDHPEARRKKPGAKQVDDWSWIFKNAKGKGYVTSFSEDAPAVGTFQYRLAGFKNPPTDYYARPFYIAADEYYDRFKNADCIGSMEVHNYHLDLARRLYEQYPNRHKFLFHFISLLSHNKFNNVGKMDDDLVNFMIEFKTKAYLNNTVLVLLGDHGWRYGVFRQTIQGKLEERLPFFAMAFPEWFKKRYPKLAKKLETNTNRLTSWYDGYATLSHLLDYPNEQKYSKHGVSLLTEVPLERTCTDAGIPTHWCPCVLWSEVSEYHNHVQKAARAAVDHINDLNFHEPLAKEKCRELRLGNLTYAEVETPGTAVLRFRETGDGDGYTPKYEMAVKLKNACHYRLTFTTSPSEAVYEANVNYVYGQFVVEKGVSRINAYGDQPKCIADMIPHLRKYCYCKAK